MKKVITLFTLLLISNACSQNENFQNSSKKILVIGTSITEGCTYVKNASKANNYISYNKAIGSSGICLNSGILGNGRDGKDLSETVQEKILRYENKVDSLTLEKYKSYSWERVIKPYLNGEIDDVDIIWFDHGYNDRYQINNELSNINKINWEISDNQDRRTFSGAFKYLLYNIYKLNPDIKIIISGYIEGESDITLRAGKSIRIMHQTISNQYGFSFLKTWEYSGFNFDYVPDSKDYISNFNDKYGTSYKPKWTDSDGNITYFQLYNPDTVHPFTDLTGRANKRLDEIFTKLLKDLL